MSHRVVGVSGRGVFIAWEGGEGAGEGAWTAGDVAEVRNAAGYGFRDAVELFV